MSTASPSIGSAPEVGKTFTLLGLYPNEAAWRAWHARWREQVGDDLQGGYATLVLVKR